MFITRNLTKQVIILYLQIASIKHIMIIKHIIIANKLSIAKLKRKCDTWIFSTNYYNSFLDLRIINQKKLKPKQYTKVGTKSKKRVRCVRKCLCCCVCVQEDNRSKKFNICVFKNVCLMARQKCIDNTVIVNKLYEQDKRMCRQ